MSTNQSIEHLQEMVVFVKVIETGSFSEAARQLGNTPSAISRSITRLEKALNIQLIQRTTRKLSLTEKGKQIHLHCLDILNAAQKVIESSGQFSSEPKAV